MCLKKVQRRATRMVKGLMKFLYETRLKRLGIYSLDRWRLRRDLIKAFNILTEKGSVDCRRSRRCHQRTSRTFIETSRPDAIQQLDRTFFSLRVLSEWNKLPQEVVEAPSTNTFTNRLDKYWNNMDVFSWSALQLTNITWTLPLPRTTHHNLKGKATDAS